MSSRSLMDGNKLYEIVREGRRHFIQKGSRLIPVDRLDAIGEPISAVILDGVGNIGDLAKKGARKQGLLKKDTLRRANAYMATKERLPTHPADYDTAVAIVLYHAEPLRHEPIIDDE